MATKQMTYLEWLEKMDPEHMCDTREQRLDALVRWTNRLYANQVWKLKDGAKGRKLDRTELTEFRRRIEPIVALANIASLLEVVRVPNRELPMCFRGMGLGTPLHAIDWQKLGDEVVEEWSDVMADADAAAEKDVEQLENYVYGWILISTDKSLRKNVRKPANRAINYVVNAYPKWNQEFTNSLDYPKLLQTAGQAVKVPANLIENINECAEFLASNSDIEIKAKNMVVKRLRAIVNDAK